MNGAGLAADLVRVVRGRVEAEAPLAPHTTYRLGGPAAVLVEALDEEDLRAVVRLAADAGVPALVVGRGSNLLVADTGFPGVAVRLGGRFGDAERDADVGIGGAGLAFPAFARRVARWGLAGAEFGVGIPGTVGGAVRMNAGAHGAEVRDVLLWADVLRPDLEVERRPAGAFAFAYRHSALGPREIVCRAAFTLTPGLRDAIEAEMRDVVAWRREHHPIGQSAGSVFRNPPGDTAGRLLDVAGAKAIRVGGARVSEKHANFILATAGATAADVRAVIEAARRLVLERTGVRLETEVVLVGFLPGTAATGAAPHVGAA